MTRDGWARTGCAPGLFNYVVSVDGAQVESGGRSSTGDDMVEDVTGDA